MFALYKRHNNSLYNKLVELSRNIYFYRDIKLNDTFDTRIIPIFLHSPVWCQGQKSPGGPDTRHRVCYRS